MAVQSFIGSAVMSTKYQRNSETEQRARRALSAFVDGWMDGW